MEDMTLTINGMHYSVAKDHADTPLLWFLRDELHLTGSKYGCGIGVCGACTVHANGTAVRSCTLTLSQAEKMDITTIEGLSPDPENLHPVQQAWVTVDVPQCGYCQAGQIMAASAMLNNNPSPTQKDIEQHMTNTCRCGTYPRIRKAIKQAQANLIAVQTSTERT